MSDSDLIRSARFREEREADWRRLSDLVDKAENRGLHRMSFQEARDLADLYRQATTSLSIAREISLDRGLLDYLEALTSRAYLSVYAPQQRLGGIVRRFLTTGGPRAIRNSWRVTLLGFMCMAAGAIAGYFMYVDNPEWFYAFMPPELAGGRGPEASTEYLRSVLYGEGSERGLGAFAAHLFSHNTRIAIFAFGLGAFLCAPTISLIFYNGLMLGVFYALHVDRGLGWDLFGWLSIHGVTELSAVCIAGAGGLKLGLAILFPGHQTRRAALRAAGHDAVKLALIAAMMLLVASLLEGFGRQLVQDRTTRIAIGWGVGAMWLTWFVLGGRARK